MHLVFLNQYYPPDAAPTGVMLEGVVERMVRDGHQVTVLCAAGGYAAGENRKPEKLKAEMAEEEDAEGVKLKTETLKAETGGLRSGGDVEHRTSDTDIGQRTTDKSPTIIRIGATKFGRRSFVGKLLDYVSYYLGVAWKLAVMQPKPDRIVALTTPPYLSILARAISKLRGADHAHWVMDLYPDVMVAHGMIGEKSAVYRILAGLARWGFNGERCAAIVTLGPDMAERCERVVGGKEELSVVSGPLSVVREEEELSVVSGPLSKGRLPGAEARQTTDNRQLTTVSWVPLWGATGEEEELSVVSDPLSVVREELSVVSGPLSEMRQHGAEVRQTTDNRQPTTLSLRAKRGWRDDELIVMYSGNMGLGHRFGEVLEVVRREEEEEELSVVSDPLSEKILPGAEAPPTTDNRQPTTLQKQRFVFYGGGKRRREIEAFMAAHPEAPVELHDYAPAEELAAHLQSADVHLVSLNAEWTGTMVPSKLQGIFAAARPVIFIGSEASSIAGWVRESGGGWVVRPDDVADLLAALDEARDPSVRTQRGQAALAYANAHFDKRKNVSAVAALFGNRKSDI